MHLTYVSLIQEEEKDLSDGGKGYFERIGQAAKRVQGLIKDLVMYSGSSSRGHEFEKMDLRIIINQSQEDYAKVLKEKKATMKTYDLCEVYIVPAQFRQIIDSLISNLLKFCSALVKPYIKIMCEVVHGDALKKINLSPEIAYSHITDTDNGRGL